MYQYWTWDNYNIYNIEYAIIIMYIHTLYEIMKVKYDNNKFDTLSS